MTRAITEHDARNAYQELNRYGASHQGTLIALRDAERNGVASVARVTVTHVGYERNATRFDASTALYRLTI